MADFDKALLYVIENEGRGYETWPHIDQPTNTGIIRADIAEYRKVSISTIGSDDVKNLTDSEISAIYRSLFWNKIEGDLINDQNIATCIFDTAVNRGVMVGIKYAQRVCNLLGGALVVDATMGTHTLASLNKMERGKFISTYENLEMAGYLAILAEHPGDERYKQGWFNRARRLFTLCSPTI